GKYIAYFQAYTNTYAPVNILREKYYQAIEKEGVVALSVATRPDSISGEALDLLEEINSKVYTFIELGLQTSNEETAKLINRGYPLSVFEDALKRIRKRNIDVVVHIIFGLPGENKKNMLNTVRYLSSLDIQGIKFHLLHLLKNTPLVNLYNKGGFRFLTEEEYIDVLTDSIGILPENIVIHRLTGDAPRELLIGPMWSLKKWEILNNIDKTLKDKNIYQGLYFHTN
ncbi:MAG: TIGR01212 family radical SAM protein, partial [Bacillota bacterium]|nr:TIGR01212 family radical SAM protein [Bacillota bacterium]